MWDTALKFFIPVLRITSPDHLVVVPVQSGLNVIVPLEFYSRYDMPGTLVWKQNILTLFTGKGAVRLADAVLRAVEQPVEFKFLYDVEVCF